MQRSRCAKSVTDDMSRQRTLAVPWLASAPAVVGAGLALTLFGSYTRGLEESGVAPGNAVNRNAVLPPVIAEQAELGVRHAITPQLSLIGAVFHVGKDIPALRADGIFAWVGQARHRGVEILLTGRISEPVSILLGGLCLDARIGGQLADAGETGPVTASRPDLVGFASISWRVPRADGLAFDGSLTHQGPEFVDRINRPRPSGYAGINTGPRTVSAAHCRHPFCRSGARRCDAPRRLAGDRPPAHRAGDHFPPAAGGCHGRDCLGTARPNPPGSSPATALCRCTEAPP